MESGRSIQRTIEVIRSELRQLTNEYIHEIELASNKNYSSEYRTKKEEKIIEFSLSLLQPKIQLAFNELKPSINFPVEPIELSHFETARTNYAMAVFRHKIENTSPTPAKPSTVIEYEKSLTIAASKFIKDATMAGYWNGSLKSFFLGEVVPKLRGKPKTSNSKKAPFQGTPLGKNITLVGEAFSLNDENKTSLSPVTARSRLSGFLSNIKKDLDFVEDLLVDGKPRATLERESESYQHSEMTIEMASVLERQGYSVYPGGVGLSNIFVMADLLAISPENQPLFVECLTQATIKKGGHLKKMELTKHIPVCFVGPLPEDFLKQLPKNSYAISHPRISRTQSGDWVPHHYRHDENQQPYFEFLPKGGRTVKKFIVTQPGLRVPEDVSGFIWSALAEFRRTNSSRNSDSPDWGTTLPRSPYHIIPFARFGKTHSIFRLRNKASELTIKLGKFPVVAEVRGNDSALNELYRRLELVGFPFKVS